MTHVAFVAPFLGQTTLQSIQPYLDLRGVKFSVITQEPEPRVPASLRERVAGLVRVADARDSRNIVTAARSLQKQHGRLDRLETYLELLQVPIAEARDALGLAGIGHTVAQNFRDKNRMKDVLRAAGVPVARQALVRSAEDAAAFVAQVGFPIVLKPLAGQGAEQTHRVIDDSGLSTALNSLLPSTDNPAQAEEFVDGDEHTLEAVTIDGKTKWLSSVQYLPTPLKVLENPWMQYCLLLPREPVPPHVKKFAPTNEKALAALGLRDGFTHMEWFLRKDGSMLVSEVAARPPGANIMQLLAAAHDTDPLALLARLVCFRTWDIPPRRHAAGCVFLRAMGKGKTVQSVQGWRTLRTRLGPAVFDHRLPSAGQPKSPGYEGDGWVILRHPTTRGVVSAMRSVLKSVRIR